MTTTAWRLKVAIKARQLSFRKLEELTGIPKSSLNRYATGKSRIRSDQIKLLADVLHVKPEWLAGWTDGAKEKKPPTKGGGR